MRPDYPFLIALTLAATFLLLLVLSAFRLLPQPAPAPVVPFRVTAPELHPLEGLLYVDQNKTIWL